METQTRTDVSKEILTRQKDRLESFSDTCLLLDKRTRLLIKTELLSCQIQLLLLPQVTSLWREERQDHGHHHHHL